MEWVCCLRCFKRLNESQELSYYVSDCGHIICFECHKLVQPHTCAECQKQNTQYKQLTNNLVDDPSIGMFFCDLLRVLKRAEKLLEFQTHHSKRSLCHKNLKDDNLKEALPPEFQFLNSMDFKDLHELWKQEIKYFNRMKVEYLRVLGLIQQIKISGVAYTEVLDLKISFNHELCSLFQVLLSVAPQLSPPTRSMRSMKTSDSRYSNSICPPPPPPISLITPLQNRGFDRSPYTTPKSGSKRLSMTPPPSDGRIVTTDLQKSLTPDSTIYKFLQEHRPQSYSPLNSQRKRHPCIPTS